MIIGYLLFFSLLIYYFSGVDGWVGKIEDKVHLSPAKAEIGAELGKNSVGKSCELQNKIDLSTETLVKVAKENNLGTISPISAKNLAVEPLIECIKNVKNVEVSRVQSVKCVVRLPDPKNMNSPKSDSNS